MQEPQETWVPSLGQEDSLEEEMASHSNILAWEIPCTEELDRLQSMGSQTVGHSTHTWYICNLQVALVVKNLPANASSIQSRFNQGSRFKVQLRRRFNPWVGKIPWRRKW